jgi:lipopolysaccharide biosynthesis glycosyltransferase
MIDVVLASDRNLIRQAGVTALSAIKHSSEAIHFTFLTPPADSLDPDWSVVRALIEKASCTSAVTAVPFERSSLQLSRHLTPVTYFRLLLPGIVSPAVTRAVYLDCDVIVGRDIAQLWATDLGGKPMAAVADADFRDWTKLGLSARDGYFNSGVLVLDLERIRSDDLFGAALRFSREHPSALTWSDQCALNKVSVGKWHRLEKHWNYQHSVFLDDIRTIGMANAKRVAAGSVLHFNNYERPWLVDSRHPLRSHYTTILNAHPELDMSQPRRLTNYWKMLKRTVKWKKIAWESYRSRSDRM